MTLMQMRPPCLSDRASWDLDPSEGAPHVPVDQMIDACLSQCPTLDLCRQLDRGDCYGVVAGRLRPWPTDTQLATVATSRTLKRVIAGIRADADALDAGDPLPDISELSRLYTTSRTTVRAALRWLAAEDVLIRPTDHRHRYRVANRTETAP